MLRLEYLTKLKEADERVTTFLINGVKLDGQITHIEANKETGEIHAFVLAKAEKSQLVNWAHVATVLPDTAPMLDGNRA